NRVAFEVPGSDGGSFVAQSNDAVTVQVTNQGGAAAAPHAFFDGSQYILYVPTFNRPVPLQQLSVYTSPTIGGPYTLFSGLPSGALSTGGGQASGFPQRLTGAILALRKRCERGVRGHRQHARSADLFAASTSRAAGGAAATGHDTGHARDHAGYAGTSSDHFDPASEVHTEHSLRSG